MARSEDDRRRDVEMGPGWTRAARLADAGRWPRRDAAGALVWACCVSSIGPPCAHRRSATDES